MEVRSLEYFLIIRSPKVAGKTWVKVKIQGSMHSSKDNTWFCTQARLLSSI